MATKSILKNINITDAKTARKLVDAMESAERKTARPVEMSRTVSNASKEEIRRIFGER